MVNGYKRDLLTDDPYAPVYYGPGNVEVSYRTTGNILQSVPLHKISLWLDGHEWYITEDTWNGSDYKGLTRVTSIAQDFDDNNMCINGPLDGDYPTRHSGLFTSGSYMLGLSWMDCLLYVNNNQGVSWTRSNFSDTAVGNYPYTPYVNASGENDWPDDTVSSIYTMRQ